MLVTIGFLLCVSIVAQAQVSCLDPNGNKVDWWFMFKLPRVVGDYKGYTYLYSDTNNPSTYSVGDLHDASNPLSQTVQQIGLYGGSVDTSKVGYVLWNDQTYEDLNSKVKDHEKDSSGYYYGHSKATIAFDRTSGFWLAHSAPGFPYSHDICPSSWTFPESQTMYAQHFFCVTINSTLVGTASFAKYLMNYHAYVYDYNAPSIGIDLTAFVAFCNLQFTPGANSLNFYSFGGTRMTAFGKNAATNSDLWEDYVAPGLGTGLVVESWCGGTYGDQCMMSYCQGQSIVNPSTPQNGQSTYAFDSIIIEEFSFGSNLYFKTDYNHAKFALSYQNSANYFCAADNNRMYSQRHRGGGALCFQNNGIYSWINTAVTALNTTCS